MSDETASRPLTAQQEQFCREYLIDLNGAQAAIRAGYSPNGANGTGSRLLAIPSIGARVAELMREREERTDITADRVLRELAAIGFTAFTDLAAWNEDNLTFTPSDELGEAAKRSVKSVKVKRTVTRGKDGSEQTTVETELTQHDKLSALDKLAKHLNLYGEHGGDGKPSGLMALAEIMADRKRERDAERGMNAPDT